MTNLQRGAVVGIVSSLVGTIGQLKEWPWLLTTVIGLLTLWAVWSLMKERPERPL